MENPNDLREQIKKECELAIVNEKLPTIDPELRHVYVEVFYEIMARDRFIKSSWPILELLGKMGEIRVTSRRPGPIRCNW